MAMQFLAYQNNPELKTRVLALMAEHRDADRLVKGTYWQDGKGCAVGCTLESLRQIEGKRRIVHGNHALYEKYLGVPRALARLEDALFEALPNGLSQAWPERFLNAIRPGADLTMVGPKFLHNLLSDAKGAVQRQCRTRPAIAPTVNAIMALYGRWIEGAKPAAQEWRAAAGAAAAAAAYAAAHAAAYAAADAKAAAAAYAAADAERIRQADALITLLEMA